MSIIDEATVPIKANPYAAAFGAKVKAVRVGRELTIEGAARELGIATEQYKYLEDGRSLPGQGLAKRIYYWIMERISFEGAGPPPKRKVPLKKTDEWRTIRFTMPKEDAKRLSRTAERLGMSIDWLCQLFVERALENKQGFVTLREAMVKLNKTRMLAMLAESPELVDVLQCDLDMVAKPGIQTTPFTRVEATKPMIVKVGELDLATEESELEEI